MIEKLGIEKEELKEELQTMYNNARATVYSLEKTAAPAHIKARAEKDLKDIKDRLDELQKPDGR
jgi:hypothetical protein